MHSPVPFETHYRAIASLLTEKGFPWWDKWTGGSREDLRRP
jgi:hypothetical protein